MISKIEATALGAGGGNLLQLAVVPGLDELAVLIKISDLPHQVLKGYVGAGVQGIIRDPHHVFPRRHVQDVAVGSLEDISRLNHIDPMRRGARSKGDVEPLAIR